MSEKRAKRERKAFEEVKPAAKKKSTGAILSNIVVVVVIAAIAGLGVYATWDKVATVFTATDGTSQQEVQTIADLAATEDMSADELLEKCGMTELGLTGESTVDEMYSKFTIESFAKYEDKTPEELKAENGIEDLPNDTNWMDASMKVPMHIVAEQSGMAFDEFAEQNGLPAEITADMTYQEAMAIVQQQAADTEATDDHEGHDHAEDAE